MIAPKCANGRTVLFANENKYSLLPAAFSGAIDLELGQADKAFCLLVLRGVITKILLKKPDCANEYFQ